MANFDLKMTDGYKDVESLDNISIAFEDGETYTIGTDNEIRVYAKATEPEIEEGFIIKRDTFTYTHKTGNKLWIKALTFPTSHITI